MTESTRSATNSRIVDRRTWLFGVLHGHSAGMGTPTPTTPPACSSCPTTAPS